MGVFCCFGHIISMRMSVRFSRTRVYCAIYSCHSAGTTSTATFLLRDGAKSMTIGMCVCTPLVRRLYLAHSTLAITSCLFAARATRSILSRQSTYLQAQPFSLRSLAWCGFYTTFEFTFFYEDDEPKSYDHETSCNEEYMVERIRECIHYIL